MSQSANEVDTLGGLKQGPRLRKEERLHSISEETMTSAISFSSPQVSLVWAGSHIEFWSPLKPQERAQPAHGWPFSVMTGGRCPLTSLLKGLFKEMRFFLTELECSATWEGRYVSTD